jgi:molecular chaperone HscB
MNPFATLGLAPSFALNPKDVLERKIELSKALHPDRYVGRPAGERRAALGKSLEVNEAARRLTQPITRAEALLEALSCPVSEDNAPQPSGAFLMDIMELRQDLRQAGQGGDSVRINTLCNDVRGKQAEVLGELEQAFALLLPAPGRSSAASTVMSSTVMSSTVVDSEWKSRVHGLLGELRYFQRFFDEAGAYLDEIA